MNNLLLIIEILFCFSALLFAKKFFGKYGVFTWIAIAGILANLVQSKNTVLFGLFAGIGHVLFSSTFLATDILTEYYSKEDAKKGVWIGLFANVVYLVAMGIALKYNPSEIDVVAPAMNQLFALNIRVTLASMLMYLVSNFADIFLYEKIKEATNGKYMWLRNNVATIICNCGENFGFAFLAFGGVFTTSQILSIAIASTVVEIIVGICDTPFLYLAGKLKEEE